jgi:hypothetical protein
MLKQQVRQSTPIAHSAYANQHPHIAFALQQTIEDGEEEHKSAFHKYLSDAQVSHHATA